MATRAASKRVSTSFSPKEVDYLHKVCMALLSGKDVGVLRRNEALFSVAAKAMKMVEQSGRAVERRENGATKYLENRRLSALRRRGQDIAVYDAIKSGHSHRTRIADVTGVSLPHVLLTLKRLVERGAIRYSSVDGWRVVEALSVAV